MFHWQIIPYLISLAITVSVAVISWRRRHISGALAYGWVAAGQASWTLGYIFELTSHNLQAKIFWDDFQWLGGFIWLVGFLAFVYQFTDSRFKHPLRTWVLISAPALIFLALVATNSYHGLVHTNERLLPAPPFGVLAYDFGIVVYLYAVYAYSVSFLSLYMLIRKLVTSHLIFRTQIATITVGALIPLIGTMFPVLGIDLGAQRDITPVTFAISNLIIVLGLLRFRLLEIAPVAYQAVFDNLPDAVMVIDEQHRLVEFNPAAISLHPTLTSEMIGLPIQSVFADMPEMSHQLAEVEPGSFQIQVASGGETKFLNMQISPLRSRGRRLLAVGWVLIFRDITDQTQAKIALENSEEKYRRLVESTTDWVWAVDADGNSTFSNSAVEDVLGITAEALRGKSPFAYMHPDDQQIIQEFLDEGLQETNGWSGLTVRWMHTNGSMRYFESTAQPILGINGTFLGLSGIDRDVTARVLAEKAAAQYAEDLKAANEELKSFSYSVSHDLRAPLRAITGFVEILHEENQQQLDQQGLEYLERVRRAGQKMNQLIDDLLRLSRVTSSEMELQQVDLSQLAENIVQNLRSLQPERKVQVEITPGMLAEADPGLVRVLLENLIGNAWKFTGGRQQAEVEVGVLERDGEQIFFVRDNGIGFDMSETGRMFDPFQRLPSSSDFEGTGVGLATVQRIVRRHKGRVWFESAPDHGATFFFTL